MARTKAQAAAGPSPSPAPPDGIAADAYAALTADPNLLDKPIKDVADKWRLLPAFLAARGLVRQHVESFNHFLSEGIRSVVAANERVTCDTDPGWYLRYLAIRVGEPCLEEEYRAERVTPQQCRLRDVTYAAPVTVDVEYTRGREIVRRTAENGGALRIGRIPLMLRCDRCVLAGKTEAQLAELGECPLDPGGYFVVRGTEKVILIQEQLSKNRIIIDLDAAGEPAASVTSSTHERKSKTNVGTKGGRIYLRHNAFTDDVNIVVALKAMGADSDQEAVALIGSEEPLQAALLPTLQEASALGVSTAAQALEHVASKLAQRGPPGRAFAERRRKSKVDEARDVLASVVLCHVPAPRYDFGAKRLYLASMARRLIAAMLDRSLLDDRDHYGNKRLELAGGLMALLFEDLFKRLNADLKRQADLAMSRASRSGGFDAARCVRTDTVTFGLESAIASGNWAIKRFRMDRRGVTQVLSRLSFIAALGMMGRMSSQFEKTRKVSGPRALHPSQWGMLCPADTPEGESCGLVKNLALMTHVTTDADEAPLARLLYALGVAPPAALPGAEARPSGSALVFLNGSILGAHARPQRLVRALRDLRRRGRIGEFVHVHLQGDAAHVSCDGGRVCRPLIICDDGAPRVTDLHISKLKAGEWGFQDFLAQGLVEYVDVNEEGSALVAMYPSDCTRETTHLEIEPFAAMGVVAGLIPFPHHNQSPRNTYQCAMGKQAMGSIGYNQLARMDALLYLLVYPQRPLLTTRTIELVQFDKLGAGQNATVAVMSFTGYDIEDAIVVNRASLDRGFGRCTVLRKHGVSLRRYPNRARDRVVAPAPSPLTGRVPDRCRALGRDGLAEPGLAVRPGDVLVNAQRPTNTRDPLPPVLDEKLFRPAPLSWKGPVGEQCIVDRVQLTTNEEQHEAFKVLVRHTRRPELGDKFSSRHGQKGVVGVVVQQQDFPFSERGVCPDLIMNPHGFPSRMTVGKLLELLGSKAAVLTGELRYGTAFGERSGLASTVETMSEALVEHGYSYAGKDFLTSGTSGEPLEAYVFMGPVYYQKLKHMVLDKMHARAKGPRVVLTRQPTEGRSRDGGLRLGEMERDCLIAYGASALLLERLMISSDEFKVHVDTRSGLLGYYDGNRGCAVSPVDGASEHMVPVRIPYACKLLFQELQSMGIAPRLRLADA